MAAENQQENWQVEVGGQIYEAVLAELPDWINEGSLLPDDKVRKGTLRWIEARRVPALVPFFNAKEKGEPLPLVQTYTEAPPKKPDHIQETPVSTIGKTSEPVSPAATVLIQTPFPPNTKLLSGDACSIHTETPGFYACATCGGVFCKACPKSFGGEVKICPNCDSLCKPIGQAAEATRRASISASATNEAFGASDLFRALAHPFKFKPSLIFGAVMFMVFTLGQSASGIGGMFMLAASIFCVMLANTLTFGVLANTVENFTQGRISADFMPSFDDFSVWDDVLHPFLLSIGVYISSFGPFVLVMIVGFYLILSSASDQMKKFQSEISRVPGTQYYQPNRTAEQSQQVKGVLEKVKQHNERLMAQRQQQVAAAESGDIPVMSDPEVTSEKDIADFENMLQETRTAQFESVAPSGQINPQDQYKDMFSGVLRLAAPLVILGAITFLWGLFYFPAACAVAGYSRSFLATINPMVGIDTIKRLGLSYVKILLMGLFILIASGLISVFLSIVFSPLDLPRMGNLPAKAVGSLFTFYFSVVFSCVIGFALFKSADRLKLYR